MTELWKDIQGYEGLYQVSNLGRVRSADHTTTFERGGVKMSATRKGRVLTPIIRRHGYLGVILYGKGGHSTRNFKCFSIHRLVAEAFVDNPEGYGEVNHLDERKTNNRADNLEWCDRKHNVNYGTTQARRSEKLVNSTNRSKRVIQRTLTGETVTIWPSMAEIQRQTGYSAGNVCNCCQRKNGKTSAYGYSWSYAD